MDIFIQAQIIIMYKLEQLDCVIIQQRILWHDCKLFTNRIIFLWFFIINRQSEIEMFIHRMKLKTSSEQKRKYKYILPLSKQKNLFDTTTFKNMTSLPDQTNVSSLTRNHFSLKNLQTQRYRNRKQSSTETQQSENELQVVRLNNFAPESRRKYVIQIYYEGKTIEFTSKAKLVNELIYEVKKHLKINKLNYQIKSITSYNLNLAMDILLSVCSVSLESLSTKNIKIRPYYGSSHYLQGLKGYEILRAIGSGGFSRVFLVRSKNNGQFYAMKAISKAFILKNKKQKLIMNEKNIMVKINHPFLAKLHHSFETANYFMLIMDYYPGGQLFGILKRFKRMNESMAKFYIIQILLGLEQLHINGIAYRDLKPENILLDRDGHACISDFGLAKPGLKSENSRTYSFCGSPQYMPPQIILKKGHSIKADYYSLGALLFQLLTGLPPFYHRNPQDIYEGTLNGVLNCPCFLSDNAKNLLQRLLCKSEDQRIGSKNGVEQILAHPWFGTIDRQNYLQKRIAAPVSFSTMSTLTFNQQQMIQKNSEYVAMVLKQQQIEEDYFSYIIPDFQFQRRKREGDCKQNMQSRVSTNPFKQKPFEKKRSINLLTSTERYKFDIFL